MGWGEVQIFTETELSANLVDLASGQEGRGLWRHQAPHTYQGFFRMLGGGVCEPPTQLCALESHLDG